MSIFSKYNDYFSSSKQPLVTENWRFFGFVNDVGEALHSFLPKSLYFGSYVITGVYAIGAVYYDRENTKNTLALTDKTEDEKKSILNKRVVNISLWHLLATVAITPLLVIPAVKAGTKRLIINRTFMTQHAREKVIPATVGILSIPAVVSPVDNLVTFGMNEINKNDEDIQPEKYHWSGYYSFMNKHT